MCIRDSPYGVARDRDYAAEVPIQTPIDTNYTDASTPRGDGSLPPNRWQPAADLLPDATADLYPSRRDAENALAADLIRGYTTGKPIHITLIDESVHDPEQTHRGIAQAIRRRGAACYINEIVRGSASHYELADVEVSYNAPTERFPLGTLTASVADRFGIRFRFVEKPWLTDLAAHRITRNRPDLLVGVGSDPESTESDALTAALRSVALQLSLIHI